MTRAWGPAPPVLGTELAKECAREAAKYAGIGAVSVTAYRTVRDPAMRMVKAAFGGKKKGGSTSPTPEALEPADEEPSTPPPPPKEDEIVAFISPYDDVTPFDPKEDSWPPPSRHRVKDIVWYSKKNCTARVTKVMPPYDMKSEYLYEIMIDDCAIQTLESKLKEYQPAPLKKAGQVAGYSKVFWDIGNGREEVSVSQILRSKNVVLFSVPKFGEDDGTFGNITSKQLRDFTRHALELKLKGADIIGVVGMGKLEDLKSWLSKHNISPEIIVPIADETGELHKEFGFGADHDENHTPTTGSWWTVYLMNHRARVVLTEINPKRPQFYMSNVKDMAYYMTYCK